jgi:antirestriction protein ArdC
MKTDIYQKATDKIIADTEHGEQSWLRLWSSYMPEKLVTSSFSILHIDAKHRGAARYRAVRLQRR